MRLLFCLLSCWLLFGVVRSQDCDVQADILFLLDASASVGSNNFQTMLNSVANITRNFNVGPNAVQFGVITFSNSASIVFDLDTYADHAQLEQAILSTKYLAQNTYTDTALRLAREQGFTAARGSRSNVPKIAIVYTDGESTQPSLTATQAAELKAAGVLVVSIGIGNAVQSELRTIASTAQDVFLVTDFSVLDTLWKRVANKTCDIIASIPQPNDCVQADILFLLDTSASLSSFNFKTMLNSVVNITRNFTLGPGAVQFGVITFSNAPHLVFDLDTYTNHAQLEKGVLNAPYEAANTYTDTALKLAREQGFTAASGSRPNVTKIAIVYTDGASSEPLSTVVEAGLLKNTGVFVLSVEIGDAVDNAELEAIASSREDVFHVNSFDLLDSINQKVTSKACGDTVKLPGFPKCFR